MVIGVCLSSAQVLYFMLGNISIVNSLVSIINNLIIILNTKYRQNISQI